MIRSLPTEIIVRRSQFYTRIRQYFITNQFLEVETPLMNRFGNIEPFLDSFEVKRPSPKNQTETFYLNTSPEYNLKILLASLQKPIFQLAHSFRAGDCGGLHTEEFLMLEWYEPQTNLQGLISRCEDILKHMTGHNTIKKSTVDEVFQTYANCTTSRESLIHSIKHANMVGLKDDPTRLRYDELFFYIYLHFVEKHLGQDGPEILYDYPEELAALSRIENKKAKRAEIYRKGVELGNGYDELSNKEMHIRRFSEFNKLRVETGRPFLDTDPQFIENIEKLPQCTGMAMGLDRLFMLMEGFQTFEGNSPFL